MPGWSKATLTQNDLAGPGLHRLTLEVPAAVASGFHAPGQYHRVRVASGEDATFAIASAPGAARFEYLIRSSDGVAGELTSLPVGSHVRVGVPEGPGFPVERARAHDLLLIGTGTGFSPLRSVVLTILKHRAQYKAVHGAYGVLTPAHLALGAEVAEWKGSDIHITPTVTTPAPGWKGEVGQVQAVVERLPVTNAIAFVCGQNEMIAEVTHLLERRGLPADRVFVNF
jgi:NAD(P)H-flavin reductase